MIFLDTNVISEAVKSVPDDKVSTWIRANDARSAIPTVVLGEITFGIERVRHDQRAKRLLGFVEETYCHYAGRIYPYDSESAAIYGLMMGKAALAGKPHSVPDGMIAAIALRHGASLATRNLSHFAHIGLTLINPWV